MIASPPILHHLNVPVRELEHAPQKRWATPIFHNLRWHLFWVQFFYAVLAPSVLVAVSSARSPSPLVQLVVPCAHFLRDPTPPPAPLHPALPRLRRVTPAVLCTRSASASLVSLPRAVLPPSSFAAAALGEGARFDSTKRKRAKMMNKHKYEKRMKKRRSLMAKNVRGSK